MAGDGISLPTTISQMGSVAKTQVKGTHQAQTATPFAEQVEKKDELKSQRVKEMEKAEQQAVDPEQKKESDKRRRRRQKRRDKYHADAEEMESDQANEEEQDEENQEQVGRLIDLRV